MTGSEYPELLAARLVVVVTGSLKGDLRTGLAVMSEVDRALAPVAQAVDLSAWSGSWAFVESPVDGDSILPALSEVVDVSVPDPLRLSVGVVDVSGAFVPLAFRSTTFRDARDEADVNAADLRSRYQTGDRPGPLDDLDDLSWWTLEAE